MTELCCLVEVLRQLLRVFLIRSRVNLEWWSIYSLLFLTCRERKKLASLKSGYSIEYYNGLGWACLLIPSSPSLVHICVRAKDDLLPRATGYSGATKRWHHLWMQYILNSVAFCHHDYKTISCQIFFSNPVT